MTIDRSTVAEYDRSAADFARQWHSQPVPTDLQALVKRFFGPGPTADIGCGSGREVAWLVANGFPAVGYDASAGLLAQARARYPDLTFGLATLPDLDGIADETFDNVLCETVIMHLPGTAIASAARRLRGILRPGGVLYLTWRVFPDGDRRDDRGRLYTRIDPNVVTGALAGATILLDEGTVSASSGNAIHRVIARKTG